MTTLTVQVPEEALTGLEVEPSRFADEIKMLAAVKLFELGKLSSGRAAEFAGITRLEFLDRLGKYHVGPFEHLSVDDLRQDFLNA